MAGYYISSDTRHREFFDIMLSRIEAVKEDVNLYILKRELCGRLYAEIISEERLSKNIRLLAQDLVREIILTNFKYNYFRNNLKIMLKDKALDSLFYTSITLYDREYDSELLAIEKLSEREITLDSIFHFCTQDLLKRWENVKDILEVNFYDDGDKDAMMEFIKHVIYSSPTRVKTVNISKEGSKYILSDSSGRNLADFPEETGNGEIASKLMISCPSEINFYGSCNMQTMQFLKNIFNDRINFFIDK